MAMTDLALVWLGTLAAVATAGLFVSFADRWTEFVVDVLAMVLWGVFGISSFDVIVGESPTASEPILPLAYLGIGLAAAVGVYTAYDLVTGAAEQARDADVGGMLE